MTTKSTTVRFIKTISPLLSSVSPGLGANLLERLFLRTTRRPVPEREQEWMNGADVRVFVSKRGDSFPVYAWGTGPTVLLVHGWSGRGSQLAVYVKPLLERGYRVVTFDAPGHGKAEGTQSALPELAEALELVARQERDIHGVIAHSLGTAAVTFALSRGLSIQRAVYIAPPDNPGTYLYRAGRFLGFHDKVIERARLRIEQRFQIAFEALHSARLARSLELPLLIFHDPEDRDVSYKEGQQLAASWPNAHLQTVEGLGHHRIVRAPEVMGQALRFIHEGVLASPTSSEDISTQTQPHEQHPHAPEKESISSASARNQRSEQGFQGTGLDAGHTVA